MVLLFRLVNNIDANWHNATCNHAVRPPIQETSQ